MNSIQTKDSKRSALCYEKILLTEYGLWCACLAFRKKSHFSEIMKFSHTVLAGLGLASFAQAASNCVCPDIWFPVCGSDGKTYGNFCEAKCEGINIYTTGECKPASLSSEASNCVCPQVWFPVCGSDGKTYGNFCEAQCAGIDTYTTGQCASSASAVTLPCRILCPRLPAHYVCGYDNITYNSECQATKCVGVQVMHDGACTADDSPVNVQPIEILSLARNDCICPEIWAPVCGADGQFYSNDCHAKCAGTDVSKRLSFDATPADCSN
jgi:hypothetical protein